MVIYYLISDLYYAFPILVISKKIISYALLPELLLIKPAPIFYIETGVVDNDIH